jgi:hypothetical protein
LGGRKWKVEMSGWFEQSRVQKYDQIRGEKSGNLRNLL